MADRRLPDGISAPLRARFDRLPADQQAIVLARLADSRRRRIGGGLALVPLAAGPVDSARPPLVVLPSMFGNVDDWRDLVRDGALGRAAYGLEVEGADAYWTANPSLEEIAAAAVKILRDRLPDVPVHLGGYSFGGRLAYEVAQQLHAIDGRPRSVIVLDAAASPSTRRPGWRDLGPMAANALPWLMNELTHYGARDLGHRLARRWRFRASSDGAPDDARLNQVFDLARFPAVFQERLRQSRRASRTYRPAPTANHLVYLRSRVRPLVHVHDADGGWGAVVRRDRLTIIEVPSDHGSALRAQWHPGLRATLRAVLARADAVTGGRAQDQ